MSRKKPLSTPAMIENRWRIFLRTSPIRADMRHLRRQMRIAFEAGFRAHPAQEILEVQLEAKED